MTSTPTDRPAALAAGPGAELLFAAAEASPLATLVTDPHRADNPIVYANRAFLEMTGYEAGEVVGRNCRFLQGPETDRGTVAELAEAIAERRGIAVEILNYRRNGSSFWNALFLAPVRDAAGEVVYFAGHQLDVSRHRDAEDALRQAQKMEAVGQLTGGIAHDFNNLLQIIVGYTDALRTRLKEHPQPFVGRALTRMADAADRGAHLTQSLLAFARKQRLVGRTVDLNAFLEGAAERARAVLGEGIALEHRLAPELGSARLDPVQAEHALRNILANARDAMPDGGRVTIETFAGTGPETPEGATAAVVGLSVSDTGEGMPPEVLGRAMEPFFTTKEQGKGTGLGLSMVYGFMKQSNGSVAIDSAPGVGTTVRLFFPVAGAELAAASVAPVAVGAPRRAAVGTERAGPGADGATVLVVEDQPDVAELARAILIELGYRVLMADNGRSALEVLEARGPVDLLFSDLIMPGGMNGVVLAREACQRKPELKVLLTTGYSEASLERRDTGGVEFEIINKPYRRAELAQRVRAVMDGPPARRRA